MIIDPLRTESRKIPTQLVIGKIADNVETAAVAAKGASGAVVIGNFCVSFFLKGALGAMYTMINSLQMVMTYSYMIVATPANVSLVMN